MDLSNREPQPTRTQLILLLAAIQVTLALASALPILALFYFYKDDFRLDISNYTFFKALPTLAFCLKPLLGLLLDCAPP